MTGAADAEAAHGGVIGHPVPGLKLAFAGTPAFAEIALAALLAAGHAVGLVLTQADRPAGRGLRLQPSPVKARAVAHAIPVIQPQGLRLDGRHAGDAAAARAALLDAAPDLLIVAAYGLILPRWLLDLPPRGCLNIHGSLLPRWRGAAPIHRAIEAGDTRTGITIMRMDEGLDTGPMLLDVPEPIHPDDTTGRLHDRLAALGGRLIVDAVAQLDTLVERPQPDAGVSYATKIRKAEAAIDWRTDAATIERRMRAFDPTPGTHATLGGELLKLWRGSVVVAPSSAAPGEIVAVDGDGVTVACGHAALRFTELQRPGGRRLGAAAFLAGRPVRVGERFERPAPAATEG